MIKLALLGCDEQTLPLVRALAEHPQFQVLHLIDALDAPAELRELLPEAWHDSDWTVLLDDAVCDAVIIASPSAEQLDTEDRAEQLRKLVQAGRALLIAQPAALAALLYYELEMLREDPSGVLAPYRPWRRHPAVINLVTLLSDPKQLGRCEQIVLERGLASSDRVLVMSQLAGDVDLLRLLAGELVQVSALIPGLPGEAATPAYDQLGLQLSAASGVLVRWSSRGVDPDGGASLRILGGGVQAVLEMPAGDHPWRLDVKTTTAGESWSEEFAAADPAADDLEAWLAAVESPPATADDWSDAARSIEVVDAVSRSVARRRTIDLHGDVPSEERNFKGLMAMLGCGLLLAALPIYMLLGLIGDLTDPIIGRVLQYLFVGSLAMFLIFQVLILALPQREATRDE